MSEPAIARSPVWPHVASLLPAVAAACRQRRTGELLLTLCLGVLQALGRHTLTQVLQSLGRSEGDWSAACRRFRRARLDLAAGRHALRARPRG